MNDDPLHDVERQLAALKPAPLPAALAARIAAQLDNAPLTLADRILAAFMTAGALAASVIVTIVILSAATAPLPSPDTSRAAAAARQQMLQEYQSLLAQR